jgi:hypothetical protein
VANGSRESHEQGGGLGVRCPRGSSSPAPVTVPSPQGRGGTGQPGLLRSRTSLPAVDTAGVTTPVGQGMGRLQAGQL